MYSTIYADPPWEQKAGPTLAGYTVVDGVQVWKNECNKSRCLPYETMTIDQICSLSVPAGNNAHLYLWATNKHLPNAFKVMHSWGFDYSTTIVWAKNMMGGGLGGIHKVSTEFLLFGTRGSLNSKGSIKGTWHNVKRDYKNGYPDHSRKPEFFRKLIEAVSPGPYLEMFARRQAAGWDVWGNEVNNSIEL